MTSAPVTTRAQNGAVPEDNPAARPKRRQFSADYKLAILEEYEGITEDGGKGALLRREGLYSSHIVEWQRARDAGALLGTGSQAPQEALDGRARARTCSAGATPSSKTSWPGTVSPSRPREKHRSSWRSCWRRALRRRTSSPKRGRGGDRRVLRPDRATARHQDGLCRRRAGPGQPLPQAETAPHDRAQAPARTAQQAERARGRRHRRAAPLAPLRRLLARPGVLHPARRGDLSGQRVELLSDLADERRGS